MWNKSNSRRDFLKILSGGAASLIAFHPYSDIFAASGKTLGPRERIPNPFVNNEGKPILAAVKGTDFRAMLHTGLGALGGLDLLFDGNQDCLINPNFVVDQYYPTTTSLEAIVGVIQAVKQVSSGSIKVGDQGYLPANIVYPYLDVENIVTQAGGVPVIFDQTYNVRRLSWHPQKPDFEVWSDIYDSSVVINMPTLKRHGREHAKMTCCLKNHVGTVNGPYRVGTRAHIHENEDEHLFQDIAELAGLVNPELYIVDARTIMTIYGPTPNEDTILADANLLIICGDIIATDLYCAQVMQKYDPTFDAEMIEPTIDRAIELGLGVSSLDHVEIIELPEQPIGGYISSKPHYSDLNGVADAIALEQNYPNPFNAATTIRFKIRRSAPIDIRLCDMLGREVTTITHDIYHAGSHTVTFNANGLPSGKYFYRLTAPGTIETKSMTLVK